MDLNDDAAFTTLDPQRMWEHIAALPDQLQTAWQFSQSADLPLDRNIHQVVMCGLGGSAIGADLLAAYAGQVGQRPVFVHRDYDLPAWAGGRHTLVVASSHSGNTEETLSAFEKARAAGCQCLAITTGGRLAEAAAQAGAPTWQFTHQGQPRAAVGFSFGLLLGLFARLELLPDPADELASAIQAIREQQPELAPESPVARNPAKRMAGQLVGRLPVIFGAGLLEPVARRWKGQINETAKAWAQFEALPEADHNTLAGSLYPEALLSQLMALFLVSPGDHPRNRLRSELTRQILMTEGLNTDMIPGRGQSALAHQWTLLHFGDYMAYYLAMAYGVDPTPVTNLEGIKAILASA